jgi:hypothetical protein
MTLEVGSNPVVIEQRIVDVKKKNEVRHASLMDDRKLYRDGEALARKPWSYSTQADPAAAEHTQS